MKSQLRDLADLIQRTAMEHPAYGQGASVIVNCVEHLSSMARCEEANFENNEMQLALAHAREERAPKK